MILFKKYGGFLLSLLAFAYLYISSIGISEPSQLLIIFPILFAIILAGIFRVAHFADHLAEIMGEPYGTLLLTISATLIEVTVMITALTHSEGNPTFIRDTITATLFIVLGGMMGLSMIVGSFRELDQNINTNGASMYLGLLIPLALLTLVLPNFTTSTIGPTLAISQEVFIGVISLALYGIFLFSQTKRYRNYFDDPFPFGASAKDKPSTANHSSSNHGQNKGFREILHSTFWLIANLIVVVLLIEKLAILIEVGYAKMGFPPALNGTTVAILVLAPEWLASLHAARSNHLQRSINIALGSGLATLSLSVPVMLFWVAYHQYHIELGLHSREIVMLLASLWVAHVSLATGKSNIMQGAILFILFLSSIFLIFNP